jgi:hypothetical protein
MRVRFECIESPKNEEVDFLRVAVFWEICDQKNEPKINYKSSFLKGLKIKKIT